MRRSVSLASASGDSSARNCVISSRVGGRPVRSRERRRIRVRLSAWALGDFSLASIRARINLSMSDLGQEESFTEGGFCFFAGTKAQKASYSAPSSIHLLMSAFSAELSGLAWPSSGGMGSSVSVIRDQASESASELGLNAWMPSLRA